MNGYIYNDRTSSRLGECGLSAPMPSTVPTFLWMIPYRRRPIRVFYIRSKSLSYKAFNGVQEKVLFARSLSEM
jgi:hypothetical protein